MNVYGQMTQPQKPRQKKAKAQFIQPSYKLKSKVGNGGLSSLQVTRAEDKIDTMKRHYSSSIFHEQLAIFKKAIAYFKEHDLDTLRTNSQEYQDLVGAVMNMKANVGMFSDPQVAELLDLALQFVDSVKIINKQLITTLEQYANVLTIYSKLAAEDPTLARDSLALVHKELALLIARFKKKYKA